MWDHGWLQPSVADEGPSLLGPGGRGRLCRSGRSWRTVLTVWGEELQERKMHNTATCEGETGGKWRNPGFVIRRSEVTMEVAFLSMERTKAHLQRGRGGGCVCGGTGGSRHSPPWGWVCVDLFEAAHGPRWPLILSWEALTGSLYWFEISRVSEYDSELPRSGGPGFCALIFNSDFVLQSWSVSQSGGSPHRVLNLIHLNHQMHETSLLWWIFNVTWAVL